MCVGYHKTPTERGYTFFKCFVTTTVKRASHYTTIQSNKKYYVTIYFKFKDYALMISTERVHRGTRHINIHVGPTLWHSLQYEAHKPQRTEKTIIFQFYLITNSIKRTLYFTLPQLKKINNIIPYLHFKGFTLKFTLFLGRCTTHPPLTESIILL